MFSTLARALLLLKKDCFNFFSKRKLFLSLQSQVLLSIISYKNYEYLFYLFMLRNDSKILCF